MNLYEDVAGEGALDMSDAAVVDAMLADEVAASFVLPWRKQGELSPRASPMIPRRAQNAHAHANGGVNGHGHANGNGHAKANGVSNGTLEGTVSIS